MTVYISPYRRIAGMREAMNRMFEETINESNPVEREMALAVDVLAGDDAYTITALIPGLEADDISIEVLNNTVTLRGEFKPFASEDAKNLMSELPVGRFGRVITLPTAVEASKTEASIKNGVLTLHVPKVEAHRPKAIKVIAG